jgi:hypothetical protein
MPYDVLFIIIGNGEPFGFPKEMGYKAVITIKQP